MTTAMTLGANLRSVKCSGCGGPRDRPGQSYCKQCHREYQIARNAAFVSLPVDMITPEQQAWLGRRRQGRRRVSRGIS